MTKFLNISTDNTLGGGSASNETVSSQKAVKDYVDGVIPSQPGNSGKFLTTNGTSVSWASVDALPSQTGQSGKFLTTDGTDASWATATKVTLRSL